MTRRSYDVSKSDSRTITLGDDLTITAVTGATKGLRYWFIFTQDGTGGRTVTLPATFLNAISVDAAANATTVMAFAYDGTNFVGITASAAVSTSSLLTAMTGGVGTISPAAHVTIDFTGKLTLQITLDRNVIVDAITGMSAGVLYELQVIQNGTGGWSMDVSAVTSLENWTDAGIVATGSASGKIYLATAPTAKTLFGFSYVSPKISVRYGVVS